MQPFDRIKQLEDDLNKCQVCNGKGQSHDDSATDVLPCGACDGSGLSSFEFTLSLEAKGRTEK